MTDAEYYDLDLHLSLASSSSPPIILRPFMTCVHLVYSWPPHTT
jgi:hypothetical protein